MRNILLLMRKDLITATMTPSTMITLALLFVCLVPVNTALTFVLVIYIMVINLFTQEENDLVCNVTGILPIRMGQAILARYLYAWALLLATAILGGLASFVLTTFLVPQQTDWFSSLFFALAAALLMMAVIMPLNYKFGVVRARVASMVIYILMVALATAISMVTRVAIPGTEAAASSLSVTAVAGIAVFAAILLSVLSLFISLRLKKN